MKTTNITKILLISAFIWSCSKPKSHNSKSDTAIAIQNNNSSLASKDGLSTINSTRKEGILLLRADSADYNKHVFTILNQDLTVYTKIVSKDNDEPFSNKLTNKIFAYYPDYYIIHFSAFELNDSIYNIKIGSETKLIKKDGYMQLLSLPDYVLTFFCTTTVENSLRVSPSKSADTIPNLNYDELSFRCIEISGDWVKVVCNKDCEGCPDDNSNIAGWIQWRQHGRIILKQYYTC